MYVKSLIFLLLLSGCSVTIDPCQNLECNAKIEVQCVELTLPTGTITECLDAGTQYQPTADQTDSGIVVDAPDETPYTGGTPEFPACWATGCCEWHKGCPDPLNTPVQ